MTTSMRWQIGDTTLTSIVEAETRHVPLGLFYPDASAADVQPAQPWLVDGMADADGSAITFRVQAFVVHHAGQTVLIDPCVGNGKHLEMIFWNELATPWLDDLRRAGVDPDDVDLVVHTHLHEDHIGWDTHCIEGEWRPTFPNARHIYVGDELEWAQSEEVRARESTPWDESIAPILAAGLSDEVGPDHDLGHGMRFLPTPGHTPGHVSLEITTTAEPLVITGDLLHHPFQFAAPDIAELGDVDEDLARRTRKDFFAEHARSGAVIAGTHFPIAPVGRILADGAAWRWEPHFGEM